MFVCLFCECFMKSFLEVKGLCFGYLKQPLCLRDISFSASEKDKILVLGLNDKGKTSLIKCLSGFETKFFGYVFLNKKEIRQIDDDKKNVSLIFDYPILLNSTIDKNLNFLYENIGENVPTLEEKIELLKNFNLNFNLNYKINKLSSFDKFKFCFLRAFIKKSQLLFVDDIFKNQFSKDETYELFEMFKKFSKDRLLVLNASERSFLNNKDLFESFGFDKVLYLNNAKATIFNDLNAFYESLTDLDAVEFMDNFSLKEGYCVLQEGVYYLCFDEQYTLKIDKSLNNKFETLKLSENENEDIVLACKNDVIIDFSKNNDFNKLLESGKVFIFSKLDRSRVI